MSSDPSKIAQYEAPPAKGLTRFWIGIESWMEDWPETPFFFWQTNSGCEYRLRPSVAGDPEAAGFPPDTSRLSDEQYDRLVADDHALWERFYVSNAGLCILIDAASEDEAMAAIKGCFPDMRERFRRTSDDTLTTLARGGRFGHPDPEAAAAARAAALDAGVAGAREAADAGGGAPQSCGVVPTWGAKR